MNNHEQAPVDAPPPQGPPPKDGRPPNVGYPIGGYLQPEYPPGQGSEAPQQKQQTGILEGCLAAICCCCLLDACF